MENVSIMLSGGSVLLNVWGTMLYNVQVQTYLVAIYMALRFV